MPRLSLGGKILILLFLGVIFAYAVNPLEESDSFYHLKTGELIWDSKSVPQTDPFSYTAAGRPWVVHEWLAELIFYGVFRLGGFWLLLLFVAGLAALTYFVILRLVLSRGVNVYLVLLFFLIFGSLTLELWVPRPQVFAYLAFTLLVYFLERYRFAGENRYLGFAVLTLWFWANVNASFVLGLAVFGLYLAAAAVRKLFPSGSFTGNLELRPLTLAFCAAVLISLLNPSGYHAFFYAWYVRQAVNMLHVEEWQSILAYFDLAETKAFLAGMVLATAFSVWWFGGRRESRDWLILFLFGGVSILPFLAIRHVGFWPLIAVYPLALGVSGVLGRFLHRFSEKTLVIFLVLLVAVLALGRYFTFPRLTFNPNTVPVQAADFIQANGLGGPVFNLYNEGGYLIWRFWPREKVFIDGRSEVYPPRVINELFVIATAAPGWEALVYDKYRVNYFLISYRAVSQTIGNLIRALGERGWVLVYWDDTAITLVKNAPANRELIQEYGLRQVNPFRPPGEIKPEEARVAAEEIRRLLERTPDSKIIQAYAAEFLASRRD